LLLVVFRCGALGIDRLADDLKMLFVGAGHGTSGGTQGSDRDKRENGLFHRQLPELYRTDTMPARAKKSEPRNSRRYHEMFKHCSRVQSAQQKKAGAAVVLLRAPKGEESRVQVQYPRQRSRFNHGAITLASRA
jgi:hypothetical protein